MFTAIEARKQLAEKRKKHADDVIVPAVFSEIQKSIDLGKGKCQCSIDIENHSYIINILQEKGFKITSNESKSPN